jgi:hypothetical protein
VAAAPPLEMTLSIISSSLVACTALRWRSVGRSSIAFVVSTVNKYVLELLSVDNYGWKL